MRDLSPLAKNSVTATSQAAGNMTSSPDNAMTAPGSQPVDPLPPTADQDDPDIAMPRPIPVSWTGKPPPRASPGWHPPAPSWTATDEPDVIRIAPPEQPEPQPPSQETAVAHGQAINASPPGRSGNIA
jgi:hypothetical protein